MSRAVKSQSSACHGAHDEFLRFLKHLGRVTPKDPARHRIADHDATHKLPNVRAWLAQHPRVRLHFILTGVSWPNFVERFCRDRTEAPIRRGLFKSVSEPQASITQ